MALMQDKVVVVTGGGRGIGRAICERFAGEGAWIVAAARSARELEETRRAIQQAGGRCEARAADVSQGEQVDGLMRFAKERCGRVDVLVNCAGMAPHCTLEALDPALFDSLAAVNMTSIYRACRAVWPMMKVQGGGVVVNISSLAAYDAFPGFAAYGASKAWVNAWTKALAVEGRPLGILVYGVAPGAVETRMLRGVFPEFPAEQSLTPADVADAVYWIVQPGARYASGQTVIVQKSSD